MNIFNAETAINTFGLAGIYGLLFVETALPLVVGLPGDSLLFIAGVAASGTGAVIHIHISLLWLALGAPVAAIAGSSFGHHLGHRYGSKLFTNPKSKFFHPDRLVTAEKWMSKYGHGKMIFIARFVPVVRHLVNPVAGIIKMPYKEFFFWNVISALVWTEGFIWGGYLIGEKLKGSVDKYIFPIVAVIVVLSVAPIIWEFFKEWRTKKHLS
ncbi:MAG: DedA family protein [Actinobacteria bacterium]|jgi:membrane-associated protein|nr:DedA family protein [Actinomycetota bacterium]